MIPFFTSDPQMLTTQIHGLRELDDALGKLPAEIAKRLLKDALRKGGETLQADAASRAPRGSVTRVGRESWQERHPGKLRENIAVKFGLKPMGVQGIAITADIGLRSQAKGYVRGSAARRKKPGRPETYQVSDVFYGRFVEFGTKKMGKRPFMRPALDAQADNVVKIIASDLSEKLAIAVRAAGGMV